MATNDATIGEAQERLMERVASDFTFHPATDITGPQHDKVREEFQRLAAFLVYNVPVGREQSLALTKLEEAMFWANAAIARNQGQDQGEEG